MHRKVAVLVECMRVDAHARSSRHLCNRREGAASITRGPPTSSVDPGTDRRGGYGATIECCEFEKIIVRLLTNDPATDQTIFEETILEDQPTLPCASEPDAPSSAQGPQTPVEQPRTHQQTRRRDSLAASQLSEVQGGRHSSVWSAGR